MKMILEAMITMIWHYNTMKKRNVANQNMQRNGKKNSKDTKKSVN